tara:strand:+ start:1396 stop:1776 length:381 start_codon:yes stop_codon:yes gene_type:complete
MKVKISNTVTKDIEDLTKAECSLAFDHLDDFQGKEHDLIYQHLKSLRAINKKVKSDGVKANKIKMERAKLQQQKRKFKAGKNKNPDFFRKLNRNPELKKILEEDRRKVLNEKNRRNKDKVLNKPKW